MFKFYWKKGNISFPTNSLDADAEWEELTELELHAKLYKYVSQTTPIIKELLQGHIYRLPNDEQFKLECRVE